MFVSFIECQRANSFYYPSPRAGVGWLGQWQCRTLVEGRREEPSPVLVMFGKLSSKGTQGGRQGTLKEGLRHTRQNEWQCLWPACFAHGGGGSGSECACAELAWKMQDTLTIMVVQSKQIKMWLKGEGNYSMIKHGRLCGETWKMEISPEYIFSLCLRIQRQKDMSSNPDSASLMIPWTLDTVLLALVNFSIRQYNVYFQDSHSS